MGGAHVAIDSKKYGRAILVVCTIIDSLFACVGSFHALSVALHRLDLYFRHARKGCYNIIFCSCSDSCGTR